MSCVCRMSQNGRLRRGRPPGEGSPGLRESPTKGSSRAHISACPSFWKLGGGLQDQLVQTSRFIHQRTEGRGGLLTYPEHVDN